MRGAVDAIRAAGEEARGLAGIVRDDGVARTGLLALVGTTLVTVLVHYAALAGEHFGFVRDEALVDTLRLDHDRGAPEILNYGQTLLAASLFLLLYLRGRGAVFAGFALIYAVIALVAALDLPALPGLRPDDSGELLAWAVVGTPLLGVLGWGFAAGDRRARGLALLVAATLGLLAAFAVGVDMAHVALTSDAVGLPAALARMLGIAPDLAAKGIDALLMTVEDGGEMLAIALSASLALTAWRGEAAASAARRSRVLSPGRRG